MYEKHCGSSALLLYGNACMSASHSVSETFKHSISKRRYDVTYYIFQYILFYKYLSSINPSSISVCPLISRYVFQDINCYPFIHARQSVYEKNSVDRRLRRYTNRHVHRWIKEQDYNNNNNNNNNNNQ